MPLPLPDLLEQVKFWPQGHLGPAEAGRLGKAPEAAFSQHPLGGSHAP